MPEIRTTMARIIIIRGEQLETLAEAAQFSARKLAGLCNCSLRQLERNFRQGLGCSPQAWLNERKMRLAQQLLLAGEPVKKVAFDLGFKHVSHFCMWFKTVNRMTPKAFVSLHVQAARNAIA
jgi:AraC family transcriptional regulator